MVIIPGGEVSLETTDRGYIEGIKHKWSGHLRLNVPQQSMASDRGTNRGVCSLTIVDITLLAEVKL